MTTCNKCQTVTDIKDMTMKMGGLLCPNCRRILFQPYVDPEFFEEYKRRIENEIEKACAVTKEDLNSE